MIDILEIKIKMTTKSNCLIGNQTESFSVGGVDQSTTIDENGKPIIHGSAFKGAFRNIVREHGEGMINTKAYMKIILDSLLCRYKSMEKTEKISKMISKIEKYSATLKAEYIFGIEGINNMPRLFCTDFRVLENTETVDQKDKNKININEYFTIETKNSLEEKSGKIISNPRTYRVVKPGVSFTGMIRFYDPYFINNKVNLENIKSELIDKLFYFENGIYGIGNSKSRGYGAIKIETLQSGENKND